MEGKEREKAILLCVKRMIKVLLISAVFYNTGWIKGMAAQEVIKKEVVVTEKEKHTGRDFFCSELQENGEWYVLSKVQESPIQEETVWITKYSEIVSEKEQLADALPFYWDAEERRSYSLKESRIYPVQMAEETHSVFKEEYFYALKGEDEIPKWIEAASEENQSESQTIILSLSEIREERTYWKDDLEFSIVFRDYGAPFYMLEGHKIVHDDTKPRLEGMEEVLLKNQGLDLETHRITGMRWGGGTWLDMQYGKCREAVITGDRLVKDYVVLYEGKEKTGDGWGYQREMKYAYKAKRDGDSKVRLTAWYEKQERREHDIGNRQDEKMVKTLEERGVFWEKEEVFAAAILFFFIACLGWMAYIIKYK